MADVKVNELNKTNLVSDDDRIIVLTDEEENYCETVAFGDFRNEFFPTSGVTAGDYISANFTVNEKGIITAASNGNVYNKTEIDDLLTEIDNNKADTDLSNISVSIVSKMTSTDKANIIDDMMPDMSAGYSVSIPFTAASAGWLYVRIADDGNHTVSVDGQRIWNTQGDEWVGDSTFLPIPKGANVTGSRVGYENKFYPCKGVL